MPIGHLTQIPPGTPPPIPPAVPKKYFLGGAGFPLFVFLVFEFTFWGVNLYLKQSAAVATSGQWYTIFASVAVYYGLIIGFILLVVMYILFALKNIFGLGKIYWLNPVIAALAIFPWWFLSSQTLYLQNILEYNVYSSMVPYLVMFILSASVCLGLCAAWFLIAVVLSVKDRRRKA
jgi:hypothetical protein